MLPPKINVKQLMSKNMIRFDFNSCNLNNEVIDLSDQKYLELVDLTNFCVKEINLNNSICKNLLFGENLNIKKFTSNNSTLELDQLNNISLLLNLKDLSIQNCKIINISFLSSLTNLEVLNLSECSDLNCINDISMLLNLKNLNLSNTQLHSHNLTIISHLTNLEQFYLINSPTESITRIVKRFTKLQVLNIYGTKIKDSKINHLKKLMKETNIITSPINDTEEELSDSQEELRMEPIGKKPKPVNKIQLTNEKKESFSGTKKKGNRLLK